MYSLILLEINLADPGKQQENSSVACGSDARVAVVWYYILPTCTLSSCFGRNERFHAIISTQMTRVCSLCEMS